MGYGVIAALLLLRGRLPRGRGITAFRLLRGRLPRRDLGVALPLLRCLLLRRGLVLMLRLPLGLNLILETRLPGRNSIAALTLLRDRVISHRLGLCSLTGRGLSARPLPGT